MSVTISNIIIAENGDTKNFYPHSLMHSIWEIRCGAFMLCEKVPLYFPTANVLFSGREMQHKSFRKRFDVQNETLEKGITLILDASVIVDVNLKELLAEVNYYAPSMIKHNGTVIGILTDEIEYGKFNLFGDYLNQESEYAENHIEDRFVVKLNYLWDALDNVASQIALDKTFLDCEYWHHKAKDYEGVHVVNPDNICLGNDVKIAPGVVLDASEGAIIIGSRAKIMPQATIIGPTSIGEDCTIKIGAKIYEYCSIGNNCKIGGELENTIIQSYSNKQHDGFLGHSYIGEWVNFGADTNNSDLKNNYTNIKVNLDGKEIETGRMFLGLLCGDHTKTGINSMFTTGTICGIGGILVREWFLPKAIPSFTWGGAKNSPIYKINDAVKTAKTVMARRNKELLPEEETIMRDIWAVERERKSKK
jgi:UDP-N-acetylglucosamine diphosphorylase/glucosamine-1-phosphate N-acetyltransferase